MAIFVFPAPRWEALIAMEMILKIIPPMMILKYRTALSCVSPLAPQKRMIGSAKTTAAMLIKIPTTTVKISAIRRTWFAPIRSFSPRRLATRADTDTFIAIKIHKPMNFGCVVRPTAATAYAPMELTISESTMPARAIKKDSITAGQAIWNAIWYPCFPPPINF